MRGHLIHQNARIIFPSNLAWFEKVYLKVAFTCTCDALKNMAAMFSLSLKRDKNANEVQNSIKKSQNFRQAATLGLKSYSFETCGMILDVYIVCMTFRKFRLLKE